MQEYCRFSISLLLRHPSGGSDQDSSESNPTFPVLHWRRPKSPQSLATRIVRALGSGVNHRIVPLYYPLERRELLRLLAIIRRGRPPPKCTLAPPNAHPPPWPPVVARDNRYPGAGRSGPSPVPSLGQPRGILGAGRQCAPGSVGRALTGFLRSDIPGASQGVVPRRRPTSHLSTIST